MDLLLGRLFGKRFRQHHLQAGAQFMYEAGMSEQLDVLIIVAVGGTRARLLVGIAALRRRGHRR